MVSSKTLGRVWKFVRENNNPYNDLENNYIENISNELDITRITVSEAVDWLVTHGLAKRVRDGQKKLVVPEDTYARLKEETHNDQEPVWR